ncbi:MAG TPA: PHP domain-containing protein, partial [Micromonosporaceae bacterium]
MTNWSSADHLTWQQLKARMTGTVVDPLAHADGGDGPGFSRKREPYEPVGVRKGVSTIPYAELHCHSNFSFLDGASTPEELVEEAVRMGLTALAITDHDNLSGVVRFAEAARELELKTVYGAELGLGGTVRPGEADPDDEHLLVLARGQEGYAHLSRQIGLAHLDGKEKGKRVYRRARLIDDLRDHAVILTGCRKGRIGRALRTEGIEGAARELDLLTDQFGRDNVVVELIDHANPRDRNRNDDLAALAEVKGLPIVATGGVHFHHPSRRRLASIVAAVRARSSLDAIEPYLHTPSAYLRSGDEMALRFARYPGAVANAARLGEELAFDLHLIAPELPPFETPPEHPTEADYLRHLAYRGAERRYGPRAANQGAFQRIDKELALIEELNFPGYFLVVWEIVDFCKRSDIFCQGRGSAANSVVCFALGITNVDPVSEDNRGLIFERFLAPERDGPPDIDVDIESDRREEVIQHVYDRYDRQHAAQVANVISYRPKSAVRDVARAFGYSPGQQDAWSKQIERWGSVSAQDGIPEHVQRYANELLEAPRHLGIHS